LHFEGSLICVAFLYRFGDFFSHGAARAAIWVPPSQPVMLAGRADDSLRVLIDAGLVVNLGGVFLLRFDIATTDLDCVQLVGSDAPIKYLSAAGLRIEMPLSSCGLACSIITVAIPLLAPPLKSKSKICL
jgi:hypothetical protein